MTAIGAVANIVGLVVGIALHVSMPVLLVMSVGCVTLCNLAAVAGTLFGYKPWLRPRLALLDPSTARELLMFGSAFFLIQIAGAVVFSSDNLVVSHYLGAAQVTPYNVTWRLVALTAVLPSLVFPALWPAYAEAYARHDYDWMRSAFRITLRGTLVLNLAFAVVFVAVGKTAIRWWAGAAAVATTKCGRGEKGSLSDNCCIVGEGDTRNLSQNCAEGGNAVHNYPRSYFCASPRARGLVRARKPGEAATRVAQRIALRVRVQVRFKYAGLFAW